MRERSPLMSKITWATLAAVLLVAMPRPAPATVVVGDRPLHGDARGGTDTRDGSDPPPGESWEGTAPAIPFAGNLMPDVHGFAVPAGAADASLTVGITWEPDQRVAYNLSLDVQQLVDGSWITLESTSTQQQFADSGPSHESLTIVYPAAGDHRARVFNGGATELHYDGSITYTAREDRPSVQTRSEADRPDATGEPSVHAVYFVPADRPDERLDELGVIERATLALNAWMSGETAGREVRFDTYPDPGDQRQRLDVTFVRGDKPDHEYRDIRDLAAALRASGLTNRPEDTEYLVYTNARLQGGSVCGSSIAHGGTGISAVLLDAHPRCRTRNFGGPSVGGGASDTVAMHELLHAFGAVDRLAPHHCLTAMGHVCTAQAGWQAGAFDPEYDDVMFNRFPSALRDLRLDLDRDDYYGHDGPWLDVADSGFLTSSGTASGLR